MTRMEPREAIEQYQKFQREVTDNYYSKDDPVAFEEWLDNKENVALLNQVYDYVENLFDEDGMVRADILGDEPEEGQDALIGRVYGLWELLSPGVPPNAVFVAVDKGTGE